MDFRILGPLEVVDDGRSLALGGARQRALLAALILWMNEVVPADRLLDEVWGEDPPASGVRVVQVYVAAAKLREALDLWRGPPLADFAYEAFAQGEIGRLEELRLAAVEARIDADLAAGRHAELVGELEALVQQHPLRERLREQLMLALYRSGRQGEANARMGLRPWFAHTQRDYARVLPGSERAAGLLESANAIYAELGMAVADA